jgi:GT2 family glycosyltransferase
LVARMDRDPTVGVLGCRIVNGFSRGLDQWIYAEPAETHERVEFETYSFSAAGAMARTDALREAGLFWKELFIYNEEVDLSIRVIRAGYKILYCPDVAVYHFPSARGRNGPDAYWRCQIRNWIWIFYRYYPAAERRRKVAMYSLIYMIKGLRNRQFRACLSGIMAGLRQTEIIGQYADKLSEEEIRRLAALNTRTRIRAGR